MDFHGQLVEFTDSAVCSPCRNTAGMFPGLALAEIYCSARKNSSNSNDRFSGPILFSVIKLREQVHVRICRIYSLYPYSRSAWQRCLMMYLWSGFLWFCRTSFHHSPQNLFPHIPHHENTMTSLILCGFGELRLQKSIRMQRTVFRLEPLIKNLL